MNQFKKDLMTNLILHGNAEIVVKRLKATTLQPEDSKIDYFFTLAQAEHYAGNQEKTVDIYRYLILKFPTNLLELYHEMVIHAPEMEEIYGLINTIVKNTTNEFYYHVLLSCDPMSLLTSKQLSLYQQRLLFIIDAFGQKSTPFIDPQITRHLLGQYSLLDRNANDLHLREKLANLCIKNIEGLVLEDFTKASPKEKIKIGICLTRYDHIDFQTLIAGLFQRFDSSKVNLIFFAAKQYSKNANFRVLNRIFQKIVFYDGDDFKQLRTLLIQEKLDILLAENVVLHSLTFIFFSRVAPIQCNIIDRVLSFGAPYVDYYLSFGNKNSYKEWSAYNLEHEKYVILENSYLSPAPKRSVAIPWDLEEIGLPKNAKFIFYPQVLARMLPEDDIIIKTLLENNPDLYFVALLTFDTLGLIWYRWKNIMPECIDRIRFMHPQPLEKFLWVIKQASVVLGSFKSAHGAITTLTVFSQGQPLLAGYGDSFASSLVQFYYQKMGIDDLLAESHDEAIRIAQRLLDDPKWKAEKSAEIEANIHKISNMRAASIQLQDFLLQAYNRAATGLAPEHWQHGNFIDQENIIDIEK